MRRAHRHGLVQLGALVVHLERGRLVRGGRQECESTQAAVGQGRVCDGCVSEAPSAMWHGVGYRSTHTLVIEVYSSESLISLPKTRCCVVGG